MRTNYNDPSKTLSPMAAHLIATLYERNRPVFHFHEAEEILGKQDTTAKLLSQLVKRGIATRLKGGTFRLIPFELGFERAYLGNPYVVARELAVNARARAETPQDYYLSHGSAFDLHQMVTQPQLNVYVTSSRAIRSRITHGTEFRFVHCKAEDLFGITEMWVDKNEKVRVSDLERTLLDGLKQPDYCGGISEVAKAFSIRRQQIDPMKLIGYALLLDIGSVIRRLGYIMELYQIGTPAEWDLLRKKLTPTYHLLDPALPAEGHFFAKWRLRLNVTEEELQTLRGT